MGATLAAVLLVGALSAVDGVRPSTVLVAAAASFFPFGLVVRSPPRLAPERGLVLSLGLCLVAGLPLVCAPALLSDDLFRYLWDGQVLLSGINPYQYAPDDPALAPLRNEAYRRMNNVDIPTVYPPLAQAFFGLAAWIPGSWSPKALALLAHLATVAVVHRLAEDRNGAALQFALHPLVHLVGASSGHIDVVAGLAVALAVWAVRAGHGLRAGLAVAAATGLKLVGLALLPLLVFWRRPAAAVALALSLLCALPLVTAGYGSEAPSGLGHYARRWRGNEGPFALVQAGVELGLAPLARATRSAPGHLRLPWLRAAIEGVRGSALDPWATVKGEKKAVTDPVDFQLPYVAGLLSRLLVLIGLLALALGLARRRLEPLTQVRWVLLLGLLCAPQVHPWYLLWLLPLEVAAGGGAALVWSAAVLVAYLPLDGWLLARVWEESLLGRVTQYGLVCGVLLWELWRRLRNTPAV